jgi:membrane protein implicated in regulation of membrane protease activity
MTVLPVTCLVVALTAALSKVSIYTNATLFAIGAVATAPIAWLLLKPKSKVKCGSAAENSTST